MLACSMVECAGWSLRKVQIYHCPVTMPNTFSASSASVSAATKWTLQEDQFSESLRIKRFSEIWPLIIHSSSLSTFTFSLAPEWKDFPPQDRVSYYCCWYPFLSYKQGNKNLWLCHVHTLLHPHSQHRGVTQYPKPNAWCFTQKLYLLMWYPASSNNLYCRNVLTVISERCRWLWTMTPV